MATLGNVHAKLIARRLTIAVAESCTGGLLAKLLTDLPGSSKYFIAGIASYHNRTKTRLLNIPARMIKRYGAVSEPVACAMAENVRKVARTDLGIGITGIAGPGGGTKKKPVGTVYIALAARQAAARRKTATGKKTSARNKSVTCNKFRFSGSRVQIRNQAALSALTMLARQLPCAPLSP